MVTEKRNRTLTQISDKPLFKSLFHFLRWVDTRTWHGVDSIVATNSDAPVTDTGIHTAGQRSQAWFAASGMEPPQEFHL